MIINGPFVKLPEGYTNLTSMRKWIDDSHPPIYPHYPSGENIFNPVEWFSEALHKWYPELI